MAQITTRIADDIKPRRVEWLIPGMVPLGHITVLDGDPGLGKSFITGDFAAALSKGKTPGPRGWTGRGTPRRSLLFSAEDDAETTTVTRLAAMGADLKHIFIAGDVSGGVDPHTGKLVDRNVWLPNDSEYFRKALEVCKPDLVVIDPIMQFLSPEVRTYSDQAIRHALSPLKKMAEQYKCAIVIVRHLNKKPGGNLIYRGGGSIGIVGLSRSALIVCTDPEDSHQRLLAHYKCNLGKVRPPWCYRMSEDAQGMPRLLWQGESDAPLSRILDHVKEKLPVEVAGKFLIDTLKAGPKPATVVLERAVKAGIRPRTLARAKKEVGIVVTQPGGTYYWELPGDVSKRDIFDTLKRETEG